MTEIIQATVSQELEHVDDADEVDEIRKVLWFERKILQCFHTKVSLAFFLHPIYSQHCFCFVPLLSMFYFYNLFTAFP